MPQHDQDYAQRQLDGLVALMAIAEPDVTVLPFAGTAVRMRYSGALEQLDDGQDVQPSVKQTGQISVVLRLMRSNQLLRSSLNIILNAGVQSAFGFAFWILAARLSPPTPSGVPAPSSPPLPCLPSSGSSGSILRSFAFCPFRSNGIG